MRKIGEKTKAGLKRFVASYSGETTAARTQVTTGLNQLNPYRNNPGGSHVWSKTVMRKNRWRRKPPVEPLGDDGDYSLEQTKHYKKVQNYFTFKRLLKRDKRKPASVTMPKLSI